MKLKAPEGVGDPCVAGVIVASRNGLYEVDSKVGALLIECFGFVEVGDGREVTAGRPAEPALQPAQVGRRGLQAAKKA